MNTILLLRQLSSDPKSENDIVSAGMAQKGSFVPLTPHAAKKPSMTQKSADSVIRVLAFGLRWAIAMRPEVIISSPQIMTASSKMRHTALFTAVAFIAPMTGRPNEMYVRTRLRTKAMRTLMCRPPMKLS